MTVSTDKKTALFDIHRELGAKMVPFGGFIMPLQYTGQLKEHQAVRESAGLFDLSHMGEFRLRGEGALAFVEELVTNRVLGTEPGQVVYSPMCLPHGGIVDDLLVYHLEGSVLLVVNAANIEKDKAWIQEHLPSGVDFVDESDHTSLLAVQGPRAEALVASLTPVDLASLPYYCALETNLGGVPVLLSRTGYTGEDGFEAYVANARAESLWGALTEAGAAHALEPIGLAARDTLRFEVGYCLYGNDIDETTSPLEAGLGWTVKLKKESFIGLEALKEQKKAGLRRKLVGLSPGKPRVIPRGGYGIYHEGTQVGEVTSGTFSPSCQKGLAMAYVASSLSGEGTEVEVDVRGRRERAAVSTLPFYREGSRKPGRKQS